MAKKSVDKIQDPIQELRASHHGGTAVLLCPGPTLRDFDKAGVPASLPRIAIGCAVKKSLGSTTYWSVESYDTFLDYGKFCPSSAKALVGPHAWAMVSRLLPHIAPTKAPRVQIQTTDRRPTAGDPEPPFSAHGDHLIWTIEVLRFMGFAEVYVYGLDLFREAGDYYWCDRKPTGVCELRTVAPYQIRKTAGYAIWTTPRLKETADRLEAAFGSGAWAGIKIFAVGSPWSQSPFPKMAVVDAAAALAGKKARVDPKPPDVPVARGPGGFVPGAPSARQATFEPEKG